VAQNSILNWLSFGCSSPIETSIDDDHENAENLVEAKDFLEEVLVDIKAARQ